MPRPRAHSLGLVAGLLLIAATRAAAQTCTPTTDYYFPEQDCLYSYTGDEDPGASSSNSISHNCRQQYRLFLPQSGTKPTNGWPVAIRATLGSYATSTVPTCVLKTSLEGKLLDRGIAVVIASLTTSKDTISCEDEPAPCGSEPLTETIPGDGTFHAPGVVPYDISIAPYDALDYDMPEKDAVMVVQHVRHNGGLTGHLLEHVDPDRIAVFGSSASAMSFMWNALGPDRSGDEPFLNLTGQFDEKTRPDVAALTAGTVWFPIFHGGLSSVPGTFELHFGDGGHSENGAPNVASCNKAELQAGSALFYEAVYDATAAEADLEPSLPLLLVYDQPSYCHDYASDGPTVDYAYSFTGGGVESPTGTNSCGQAAGGVHPRWSGFLWKSLHPTIAQLCLPFGVTTCAGETGIEYRTPGPSLTTADFIANWIAGRLAVTPSPWSVFEYAEVSGAKRLVGIPGTLGLPELIGVGQLTSSSGNKLALRHGAPGTTAYLVWSATTTMSPTLGGVSLVTLDNPPLSMSIDANGDGAFTADALVSQPSGSTWWFQVWMPDSAAVQGYSASNAIRATVP